MKIIMALTLLNKDHQLPTVTADRDTSADILNIFFVTIGAVAFLMLIIAGVRYIIFGHDPAKVAEIKKQILYILVGLAVVALAATVVNFVLEGIG